MPLITRRRAKRTRAVASKVFSRDFPRIFPNAIVLESTRTVPACFSQSVAPYSDALLRCRNCSEQFLWTAEAQRTRYEVFGFSGYSYPPYCPDCSRAWHRKKNLLAEYDAKVGAARTGGDLDAKRRVLALLGELDADGYELTGRMIYTQEVLSRQLAAAARRAEEPDAPQVSTRNHRPLGR